MSVGALKRKPVNTDDALPLHLEHQLLIRTVAALQARVTDMVQAHRAQQQALEGEIVRLRARAMVDRTRRLWALPERLATRRGPTESATAAGALEAQGWQTADAVLCQTGCVGHAHAWLGADGSCSRTGRVCAGVPPTASKYTRHDAEPDLTEAEPPYR